MNKLTKRETVIRLVGVLLFFAALFYAIYSVATGADNLSGDSQRNLYSVGIATLLSGLATLWLSKQIGLLAEPEGEDDGYGKSFFPILSGCLALVGMSLAYIYLGMWPVGTKCAMIVDMHHQYAPLLQQLRTTLLGGDSLLYSFDLGMGASFIPLIGYYLASPLNLLLILFPDNLLPEAILVITLLKNMLTAALMAACLQYVYKKQTYAIPVISVMFSMMMYLIAYSWNIMWLDCVMILPLVILGFERMLREKKPTVYVLSLAFALYVNYYIAFMLCIFLVLYFVVYALREKREPRQTAVSFLTFGGASVIAAMIASVTLLPIVMSLGQTSAAGGGFNATWAANFDIFKLLGRHLYDVSPTIRSGNLPNLYCGVLAVLLLPLYATTKKIPKRRRGAMVGLLTVLAFSMVLNNTDLLWHGLHSPNDLPYRYSFLYCFVLLLIGYETLLHIRDISAKQVGFSFLGLLAYIVVEERFGEDVYDFRSLYISLALLAIYAVILLMIRYKRLVREAGYILLAVIVLAELVTGTGRTFVKMNQNEYFTSHADYLDNDISQATQAAVDAMETLGDEATGDGFYRVEFLPRRTCADTAMFDYNGITIFASSNPYKNTRFMGGLGYAVNGVNSYLYHAFVPLTDSLFGLRYVAASGSNEISRLRDNRLLTEQQTVTVGDTEYTIFENTSALSVGYRVNSAIKGWNYDTYNPFESNNSLITAMTGNGTNIYDYQTISAEGEGSVTGPYAVSVPEGGCDFTANLSAAGHVYAFVDCRAADGISISATYQQEDGSSTSDFWSMTSYEPYIIDAGYMDVNDTLRVTINTDSICGGNVYVVVMNEEAYDLNMQTLAADQMNVTTFTDTRVEGTVDASANGTFFTSMVYDEGWTVKVDGQTVETYAVGNAMLAFDIAAGEHTVTMTFFPTGLVEGILLCLLGILLLIFIVFCLKHPDRWQTLVSTFKKPKKAVVAEETDSAEKATEEVSEKAAAEDADEPPTEAP